MRDVLKSFQRARANGLGRHFYERLLPADPRIERLFANTDLARQRELFEHGVYMLIKYAQGAELGKMALDRLGRLHDRQHLDVPPDLYAIWQRCLIETLRELDPELDADLEKQWLDATSPGIDEMSRMYDPDPS